MSDIVGSNTYTFFVNNSAGTGVTSIPTSSFSVFGYIGTDLISSYTNSISEKVSGYYQLSVTLNSVGDGYLGITHPSSAYAISPSFYAISVLNNDADSIAATLSALSQEEITTSQEGYTEILTNSYKEGDDITLIHTIPTTVASSISGWTNWRAEIRTSAALTSAGTVSGGVGYLGSANISVYSVANRQIQIDIPYTITTGIVPAESNDTNIYFDLQAITDTSKRKTVASYTVPIVRQLTY